MLSSTVVASSLEGIEFPATKEDILKYARERNAPPEAMKEFKAMPEGTYHSMAAVWDGIGGSL